MIFNCVLAWMFFRGRGGGGGGGHNFYANLYILYHVSPITHNALDALIRSTVASKLMRKRNIMGVFSCGF